MAQVHHRISQVAIFNPITLGGGASEFAMLVAQANSPTTTGLATMLRTRADFTMTAQVGVPGSSIPGEAWWAKADAWFYAYWVPDGDPTILPLDNGDFRFLGAQKLNKTLVASPSQPTSYYVNFATGDDLVTTTARKPVAPVGGPSVNYYMVINDPGHAFGGTFGGIRVDAASRQFVLWGDTV